MSLTTDYTQTLTEAISVITKTIDYLRSMRNKYGFVKADLNICLDLYGNSPSIAIEEIVADRQAYVGITDMVPLADLSKKELIYMLCTATIDSAERLVNVAKREGVEVSSNITLSSVSEVYASKEYKNIQLHAFVDIILEKCQEHILTNAN